MALVEVEIELPEDFAKAMRETENDLKHYPDEFVRKFEPYGSIMDIADAADALGVGQMAIRRILMKHAEPYGPEPIPRFPKVMFSAAGSCPFNRPRWAWPTTAFAAWAARTGRVDVMTGDPIRRRGRKERGTPPRARKQNQGSGEQLAA